MIIQQHGVNVLNLVGVLFIGLKVSHVIDWSWIWVVAPIWAQWIMLLIGLGIVYIGLVIAKLRTSD